MMRFVVLNFILLSFILPALAFVANFGVKVSRYYSYKHPVDIDLSLRTMSRQVESSSIPARVKVGPRISTVKPSNQKEITLIQPIDIKPWTIADAYNSTTMKTIIAIQVLMHVIPCPTYPSETILLIE
jgi:hypothetical protein